MLLHAISASIALTAATVDSYAATASLHVATSSSLGGQRDMWWRQRAALRVWTTSIEMRSV
jgi:hypothetical protein